MWEVLFLFSSICTGEFEDFVQNLTCFYCFYSVTLSSVSCLLGYILVWYLLFTHNSCIWWCFCFQLLLLLQKQSQDTEESGLTSDADIKLDMNHFQSIFVKASVNMLEIETSWLNQDLQLKTRDSLWLTTRRPEFSPSASLIWEQRMRDDTGVLWRGLYLLMSIQRLGCWLNLVSD